MAYAASSAVALYRRPASSQRSGMCVAPTHCTARTAPEEPGINESPKLADARQEQFVLHDAVLHARGVGTTCQVERLVGGRGPWLLAIDMLAPLDRPSHVGCAHPSP